MTEMTRGVNASLAASAGCSSSGTVVRISLSCVKMSS